ncbi:MAG: zinc ribbon domain-containing protein [Phycisphaerae bacterium]|nr:zinc ribbon domain-containing protein [Phycisphaerae bacterium]
MGKNINTDGHKGNRAILRVIGPVVLGVGLLFAIVGIGSFFSSIASFFSSSGSSSDSFDSPLRYFWCAFIGIPLIGVGGAICKFAFMGAVTRYMANEVTPVGKDVVNYMADGTKEAVRDISSAIGEGLASSNIDREVQVIRCHKCNENNEDTANFCKSCGASLSKSIACPKCGELNDADARFCDNCGQGIT